MQLKEKIKKLIKADIESDKLKGWSGFEKSCIEPIKETYIDSYQIPEKGRNLLEEALFIFRIKKRPLKKVENFLSLYTVWHEYPNGDEGYIIAYNPEINLFHLSYKGEYDGRLYIFWHTGSFADVLKSM